jgi:hypothetical protein
MSPDRDWLMQSIVVDRSFRHETVHHQLSGLPRLDAAAEAASDDPRFPNAPGIVRVARGCMGTGGIEHWRIARQAAGEAPAPVRAPQEQGAPRIANG